jgi:hypothetical protein
VGGCGWGGGGGGSFGMARVATWQGPLPPTGPTPLLPCTFGACPVPLKAMWLWSGIVVGLGSPTTPPRPQAPALALTRPRATSPHDAVAYPMSRAQSSSQIACSPSEADWERSHFRVVLRATDFVLSGCHEGMNRSQVRACAAYAVRSQAHARPALQCVRSSCRPRVRSSWDACVRACRLQAGRRKVGRPPPTHTHPSPSPHIHTLTRTDKHFLPTLSPPTPSRFLSARARCFHWRYAAPSGS